jgi:N-acetylglucosaminyldiphosphoundecaprenol N-acetyl-beta-D-mannosaminyltransferase
MQIKIKRTNLCSEGFVSKDRQEASSEPETLRGLGEATTRLRYRVLGILVDAVQISDVIVRMEEWIARRSASHFIAVTGMHGVVEAQHDESFKEVLNDADLVVPDGMPLVLVGRKRGYPLKRRVYGPELMETFCRVTGAKYRHFLYGGAPGVAEDLATFLHRRCGALIVGTHSPPFRALEPREDAEIVKIIHDAAPDVLWIGLSTPKQERWMYDHKNLLRVPVMVGVGAAFDLLTGKVKQAPRWMQESGLEWVFRLRQEPRRLWRRYLIYGSEFAWKVSLEAMGIKSLK